VLHLTADRCPMSVVLQAQPAMVTLVGEQRTGCHTVEKHMRLATVSRQSMLWPCLVTARSPVECVERQLLAPAVLPSLIEA